MSVYALIHVADRKSTRLNSSHVEISYAVFCLKKKTRHLGQVGCDPVSAPGPLADLFTIGGEQQGPPVARSVHPADLACLVFFFFNDTATTEIYTLSLHDALPI